MPDLARKARVFVLFATALMAVRGESLALPVAHLFADHHHEIVFSPASGSWQWVAVADDRSYAPELTVMRVGHDHEIRSEPVPLLQKSKATRVLGLILSTLYDGDHFLRRPAHYFASLIPPPDIGKPDLALLDVMRV